MQLLRVEYAANRQSNTTFDFSLADMYSQNAQRRTLTS
jgi:hypothetical protein